MSGEIRPERPYKNEMSGDNDGQICLCGDGVYVGFVLIPCFGGNLAPIQADWLVT